MPALTVCRDEYLHRVTEGPDPPCGDGRNPHGTRGIVGLDRKLSKAAVLAGFFRELFLGTERKGKEKWRHQGFVACLPAVPLREAAPPTSQVAAAFPQHPFLTLATAKGAKRRAEMQDRMLHPRALGTLAYQAQVGMTLRVVSEEASTRKGDVADVPQWQEHDCLLKTPP